MFSYLKSVLIFIFFHRLIRLRRIAATLFSIFYSLFSILLSGCTSYYYKEAVKLEKQGLLLKAAMYYEMFAKKHPSDIKAPESLLKSAEIYSKKFHLCHKSRPIYEYILRSYSKSNTVDMANMGLFVCPDYFTLASGKKWVYGDSQTGGENMKQQVHVKGLGTSKAVTRTLIFAGENLVQKLDKIYLFSGLEFIERQSGFDTIILKYPITQGTEWISKNPKQSVKFKVERVGVKVQVRAGEFADCIKIKQQVEGISSWVYDYYAPWVGKVLVTVAGPGYENRVMELISYEE